MFWDQASFREEKTRSVILGNFELDRLQPPSPSIALEHISISVHADGPTRVLSIVDARNKGVKTPALHGESFLDSSSSDGELAWNANLPTSKMESIFEECDPVDIESFDVFRHQQQEEQQDEEQLSTANAEIREEYANDPKQRPRSLRWSLGFRGSSSSNRSILPSLTINEDQMLEVPAPNLQERTSSGNSIAVDAHQEKKILDSSQNASIASLSSTTNRPLTKMDLRLNISGFGVSVVESFPRRELLYMSMIDIESRFASVADLSKFELRIGWTQVDNQIYGAYYPVMFAPRLWNQSAIRFDSEMFRRRRLEGLASWDDLSNPSGSTKASRRNSLRSRGAPIADEGENMQPSLSFTQSDESWNRPSVAFTMIRSNRFPSLDFVRHVSVSVQPMNLKVEPELLTALLAFGSRCAAAVSAASAKMNPQRAMGDSAAIGISGSTASILLQGGGARPAPANRNSSRNVVLSGDREGISETEVERPDSEGSIGDEMELLLIDVNRISSPTLTPTKHPRIRNARSTGALYERRRKRRADSESDEETPLPNISSSSLSETLDDAQLANLPATQRKLYIEELLVHPVKIHVSFSFRSNRSFSSSSRFLNREKEGVVPSGAALEIGALNPLRFALNAMGASLANVENAPLRLNALLVQNSLSTTKTVLERIFAHYRSQALRQAYLILGSVDLLGDPRGLVKNLGAGVMDFFYEPALGLVRSPKDFGAGLAKGTISLVRRTILGAATSITGFSNGASALFDSLSNDKYTGFEPKSVVEGFVQGVAGLVVAPVSGLKEEGLIGLGKGTFFGITGVFVKPMAGLFKVVKYVTLAIQSTVDPSVKLLRRRIRPPRYFERLVGDDTPAFGTANKVMVPFDHQKAVGEEVIAMVDHGAFLEEGHVAHIHLGVPRINHQLKIQNLSQFLMSRPGLDDANQATFLSSLDEEERTLASAVFTIFTLHEQRPLPNLALWKKMMVLATNNSLLYVEETLELERSTWAVSLADVMDIRCNSVEHSLDPEDLPSIFDIDGTGTNSKQGANVVLRFWQVKIIARTETVFVYTWTKANAERCRSFVSSLAS